jgi:hypothetical protein
VGVNKKLYSQYKIMGYVGVRGKHNNDSLFLYSVHIYHHHHHHHHHHHFVTDNNNEIIGILILCKLESKWRQLACMNGMMFSLLSGVACTLFATLRASRYFLMQREKSKFVCLFSYKFVL